MKKDVRLNINLHTLFLSVGYSSVKEEETTNISNTVSSSDKKAVVKKLANLIANIIIVAIVINITLTVLIHPERITEEVIWSLTLYGADVLVGTIIKNWLKP